MNIFSRLGARIRAILSNTSQAAAAGRETPKIEPKPRHMIRLRPSTGRPIFGPSFPEERAGHHFSRQTSRGYLRTRFFAAVSEGNPLMSRRERRHFSRLFTCLEYRRMMTDETNAIPDEAERIYRDMTKQELAA